MSSRVGYDITYLTAKPKNNKRMKYVAVIAGSATTLTLALSFFSSKVPDIFPGIPVVDNHPVQRRATTEHCIARARRTKHSQLVRRVSLHILAILHYGRSNDDARTSPRAGRDQ
jgi:hypothetical protein